MKNHTLSISSLLLLLAFGCKKDTPYGLSENRIRFDQMEVGQKSRYLSFQAGTCFSPGNTLTYAADTLVLEIVEQQADTFIFKETLTPFSFSVLNYGATSTSYNVGEKEIKLYVDQNTVHVLTKPEYSSIVSRLFSKLSFPLKKNDDFKLTMSTWYPNPDNSKRQGYVKNHKQARVEYPRLNFVLDYKPMEGDGPGCFYLYSAEYGIVRSGERNGWCTDKGRGWDLLPE